MNFCSYKMVPAILFNFDWKKYSLIIFVRPTHPKWLMAIFLLIQPFRCWHCTSYNCFHWSKHGTISKKVTFVCTRMKRLLRGQGGLDSDAICFFYWSPLDLEESLWRGMRYEDCILELILTSHFTTRLFWPWTPLHDSS